MKTPPSPSIRPFTNHTHNMSRKSPIARSLPSRDLQEHPCQSDRGVPVRLLAGFRSLFLPCIICASVANTTAAATTNFPPIGTNPVYSAPTVVRINSNTVITTAGATTIANALNALGLPLVTDFSSFSNASPDYLTLTNLNYGRCAILRISSLNLTNFGAWLTTNSFNTHFLSQPDWRTWLTTNQLISADFLAATTNAVMAVANDTFCTIAGVNTAFLHTTNDLNARLASFSALDTSNTWSALQFMPGLVLTNTYTYARSWQLLIWEGLWNIGAGTVGDTNLITIYPLDLEPGTVITLSGYPQTNVITSVQGSQATVLNAWTQTFSTLLIYRYYDYTITNAPQVVFPTGIQTAPFLADWNQLSNRPSLDFDARGSAATIHSNLANCSVRADSLFVAGTQVPAANLSNATQGVSSTQVTQAIVNVLTTNLYLGGNVVGTGNVLNASIPVTGAQFAAGAGSQTTNAGTITLTPTLTNGANIINANATSIFGNGVIPSGFLPASGMRFWKTVSTGSTNYTPLHIYPPPGTKYLRLCGLLGCPNNPTVFGFNNDINGQQYVCAIYEITDMFTVWLQGSYCGGIPTTAGWRSGFGYTQQWDVLVYNMSGMPGALHGLSGHVWGPSLANTNFTHFMFEGYWTNSTSDITNMWITVGSNCMFDLFVFP